MDGIILEVRRSSIESYMSPLIYYPFLVGIQAARWEVGLKNQSIQLRTSRV